MKFFNLRQAAASAAFVGSRHPSKRRRFFASSSSSRFSFLSWYSRRLDTHPLSTKAITSGLIAGAGDFGCQVLVDKPEQALQNDDTISDAESSSLDWWDRHRTGRFTLLGACLVAPVVHFWYHMLATRILPGTTAVAVVKRVVLDQFAFAPCFMTVWLASLWTLEGKMSPRVMPNRLVETMPSILVANYILWIPAQVLNFRFVAVKYQVLYSNVVALLWNFYLSYAMRRRRARDRKE